MKVLAISVSPPKAIATGKRTIKTGIFKTPVEGRVRATQFGLDGDGQADREAHGGVDKALYVYSVDHYRFWQQALQRTQMPYGQFGENLTVQGMMDDQVHIGDQYRIGELLTQVTQPRVPCFKLGVRMNLPDFPRRFMRSGRVGFYLRVLQEGAIAAGDSIERICVDPVKLTVQESLKALVKGPQQKDVIRKALQIEALSDAWRQSLNKRL